MDKLKWRITIDITEVNSNLTGSGELYDHLMDWLKSTKLNGQIKDFNLRLENPTMKPKKRD